ncbi:glycoside hydrolase family 108 protein [Pedobacter antarcticus]|uniref:glycoside hydrolase family 108 protein n=1 Tax=Pedobacter antarcticus TaxID=34086 RepID=UPI00292F6611|nr:glycosyl hydrolase 108 family protein [Pedobacter antarcticus]
MANFEEANKITGMNEGGYANHRNDKGGETYAGISRRFWSNWTGWKYIDKYKDQYTHQDSAIRLKYSLARWINSSAAQKGEPVNEMVKNFYKINFWDANKLDELKCQQLANSVYDFGVNAGNVTAIKLLQKVVNTIQDGRMGEKTITATNSLNCRGALGTYNSRREEYYRSIAKGDQAQFLKVWLSRIKPYKTE